MIAFNHDLTTNKTAAIFFAVMAGFSAISAAVAPAIF